MDRKIVLSVIGAAILGFFAILLLMPTSTDDGIDRMPWQFTQDGTGRTHVFGLTLGQTTLNEVRAAFGEIGEITLFQNSAAAQMYSVEAFFEQIYLKRLRADFVMTLDVEQATLSAMSERGLRISQLASGSKKIKLDPADAALLANRPIRSIAYLPKARLDSALIEQRFGAPSEQLTESKSGIVHWLYPQRGLDIARDPAGQTIIQYVNPSDFDSLRVPLD